MKIVSYDDMSGIMDFQAVNAGEVFFRDEEFYIKGRTKSGQVLCINLGSGDVTNFDPGQMVRVVPDAELHYPTKGIKNFGFFGNF